MSASIYNCRPKPAHPSHIFYISLSLSLHCPLVRHQQIPPPQPEAEEEGEAEMSRACGGDADGSGEIMLFGVRVVVDAMRKSVSLNNLSQYEQPQPEEPSKVNTTTQQQQHYHNKRRRRRCWLRIRRRRRSQFPLSPRP
jgi:hypothetical protein